MHNNFFDFGLPGFDDTRSIDFIDRGIGGLIAFRLEGLQGRKRILGFIGVGNHGFERGCVFRGRGLDANFIARHFTIVIAEKILTDGFDLYLIVGGDLALVEFERFYFLDFDLVIRFRVLSIVSRQGVPGIRLVKLEIGDAETGGFPGFIKTAGRRDFRRLCQQGVVEIKIVAAVGLLAIRHGLRPDIFEDSRIDAHGIGLDLLE